MPTVYFTSPEISITLTWWTAAEPLSTCWISLSPPKQRFFPKCPRRLLRPQYFSNPRRLPWLRGSRLLRAGRQAISRGARVLGGDDLGRYYRGTCDGFVLVAVEILEVALRHCGDRQDEISCFFAAMVEDRSHCEILGHIISLAL